MIKRITTSTFIDKAKSVHGNKYDYSKVDFKCSHTKVTIKCKSCNNEWDILPSNHTRGSGCKLCQYKKLPQNQSKTNEIFLKEAIEIHGNKFEYLSEYKTKRKKISIKCLECGTIFEQNPSSHLNGSGCLKCFRKNAKATKPKPIDKFELECIKIHNNRYKYFQDYIGTKYNIKILCLEHNIEFYQNAGHHLYHRSGCYKCNYSKGENRISDYFEQNFIEYEYNKKFENCKNVEYLRFDFYIPKYNTCIEYDGGQHFKSVKKFGGDETFQKIQINDQIKNEFCQNNNIKLIRIKFNEFNKIEEILNLFIENENNVKPEEELACSGGKCEFI